MKNFVKLVALFVVVLLAGDLSAQALTPKSQDDKIGFFDGDQQIIDYRYDEVRYAVNSGFIVRLGGYWGLISSAGEELITCKYDLLHSSSGSEDYIAAKAGAYGVVNAQDSVVMPFTLQNIDHYVHDSIALVKQNEQWGYLVGPTQRFVTDTVLVYKRPEQRPLFDACEEGGTYPDEIRQCSDKKMMMFVYQNIRYPQRAIDQQVQGIVVVSFLIDVSGQIDSPAITREIGSGCGAAALKVVNKMGKWVPGTQDGVAVTTRFYLPVRFKLE